VRTYQNLPGPNAGAFTATAAAAAAARSSKTPGARKALAGEVLVCAEGATPVAAHPDSAPTTQATETMDPLNTPLTLLTARPGVTRTVALVTAAMESRGL
jgi:hypothetical protein